MGLSYILYFFWNVKLASANYNDETRRNYYLAAAEVSLCQSANIKPVPTQYDRLPNNKIMKMKLKNGWRPFWENWSIWFTTLLPFLLVVVLVFQLCCCYENIVCILSGIGLICLLIFAIIFCETSSKRKDK